jgi:catechol 2,3-dioxygenase-like lactoylglutathione lyase family enzyme
VRLPGSRNDIGLHGARRSEINGSSRSPAADSSRPPRCRWMSSARLVGINHVALEVGDLDAALDLYGRLFCFELRGRVPGMAFLDLGDQFLAIAEGRRQGPDDGRHFGLVVDDRDAVQAALAEAGIDPQRGCGLRFRRPVGQPGRDRRVPGVLRRRHLPRRRDGHGPGRSGLEHRLAQADDERLDAQAGRGRIPPRKSAFLPDVSPTFAACRRLD